MKQDACVKNSQKDVGKRGNTSSVVSMSNTYMTQETLDQFFTDAITSVNDELYTHLLDEGMTPGEAWEVVFLDIPTSEEFSHPDFELRGDLSDHDAADWLQ